MDGVGPHGIGDFAIKEGGYMMAIFEEGNSSQPGNTSEFGQMQGKSKTSTSSPQNFINATPSMSSPMNTCDSLIKFLLRDEPTRWQICQRADLAMKEFLKLTEVHRPLWQPHKDLQFEIMDKFEYLKKYGGVEESMNYIMNMNDAKEIQELPSFDSLPEYAPAPKETLTQHVETEGSRSTRYVKMNPTNITELLMNSNEWSGAFHNIVASSSFLEVLMNGVDGSNDGKLQLMNAEFQLPTPFVDSWECYFARYCKKLSDTKWCVVDFSLDKFLQYSTDKFRRRPSGCLIKEMSYGYSKVTWVENMVAVDKKYYNSKFKPLISSGLAFGAPRWLDSLAGVAECVETLKANPPPAHHGGKYEIKRVIGTVFMTQTKGLLNLAGRMMRIFCGDINASLTNLWMQVADSSHASNYQGLRIRFKNPIVDSTGRPQLAVIFSACVWLPIPPWRLFDFLREANSIAKWGVSSQLSPAQELGYVIQGNDARNRVSIIQTNIGLDQEGMLYVQESHRDSTNFSYVVYTHVEKLALSNILSTGNQDNVTTIMPSGYTILPDGMIPSSDGGDTGSILTITNNAVLNITPNKPIINHGTVEAFNTVIANTIKRIKAGINNNNS